MRLPLPLISSLALLATACQGPVFKPEGFDPEVLQRQPLPGGSLLVVENGERAVDVDFHWLAGIDREELAFVRHRLGGAAVRFCVVVRCDPDADLLVLLPLEDEENALTVLADAERRAELTAHRDDLRAGDPAHAEGVVVLSLKAVVRDGLLGSPIPHPRHVFAVAANFPSHLRTDLKVTQISESREALSAARARVFLKHPSIAPEGMMTASTAGFSLLLGPFDEIRFPKMIALREEPGGPQTEVLTALDYEVELGAVMGRTLTTEDIATASDEELRAAIAGYALVSDTKARNPQILSRVINMFSDAPDDSKAYRPDDAKLQSQLGFWDHRTYRWWSYAASYGTYTAVGPFFVAAPADGSFPTRDLITARTYGAADVEGPAPPGGRERGVFYLRQCSVVSEADDQPDRLIWNAPQIIRSILAPDSVVELPDGPLRIEQGDIICLGTPAGPVVTAKSGLSWLKNILFWWSPLDWHDAFFSSDQELYLRDGDQVFYWIEGLGGQLLDVTERE